MSIVLSGLKKAPKKASEKEKPLLPDPTGELSALVNRGVTATRELNTWEAEALQVKAGLGAAALKHAFNTYAGRSGAGQTGELDMSFKLSAGSGAVTISLTNKYKMPEDVAALRPLLREHADTFIIPSFTIGIKSDEIPDECKQELVDRLVLLLKELDDNAALARGESVPEEGGPCYNAVQVKETVALSKRFHQERHALFTPAENLAIQAVAPCTTSCRFDH